MAAKRRAHPENPPEPAPADGAAALAQYGHDINREWLARSEAAEDDFEPLGLVDLSQRHDSRRFGRLLIGLASFLAVVCIAGLWISAHALPR